MLTDTFQKKVKSLSFIQIQSERVLEILFHSLLRRERVRGDTQSKNRHGPGTLARRYKWTRDQRLPHGEGESNPITGIICQYVDNT